MKKLIFVVVVIIAGLSASCKKSYTCYCVVDGNGNTTTSTVKAYSTTDAQTACLAKGSCDI